MARGLMLPVLSLPLLQGENVTVFRISASKLGSHVFVKPICLIFVASSTSVVYSIANCLVTVLRWSKVHLA
jgi:hypothetical protein